MMQTEERARAARGLGGDGAQEASTQPAAPAWLRHMALFRGIVAPLVVLGVGVVALLGYIYWLDQTLYVFTDNAQVTASLVQVGSPANGQVRHIAVDVGDQVVRNQVVATIILPTVAQMNVRSPIDGTVVAVGASPGDLVTAGRPIVTLVDPAGLSVQAQIEETKVSRVRPGQEVEVWVDSLGQSLRGRVVAVGPASAAALAGMPQSNLSGYFVKAVQLVPVQIDIDYAQHPLVVGGSAVVKIRVQE